MSSTRASVPEAAVAPVPIGGDLFRSLLRQHSAGVAIVTADVAGEPVGLTLTSFTGASLNPPLVTFYVANSSSTWPRLRRAGVFGVHLLCEGQADLAARFAAKGPDRFAPPTSWWRDPLGVPRLDGAAALLVCRARDPVPVGDHWLVVGEVVHGSSPDEPLPPLLYHRGGFGGFRPPS